MVSKVNKVLATRDDFTRENGVMDRVVPSSKRKYNSYTTFKFDDKFIAKLPFCSTAGGVDLYDHVTTTDKHGKDVNGAILVLRIQKKTKTFYFRYKNKMYHSLGRWTGDTSRSYYKKNEAVVRIARERMAEEIRLIESRNSSVAHIAEWTIEDYVNRQYPKDRQVFSIQNGQRKDVTEDTIQCIKRDLGDLKFKRIKDVEACWIDYLIEEWKKPKLNEANGKTETKSLDTCRRAYTAINAMFNICVKAGYIALNPLRDQTWQFRNPDTSEKEINTIEADPDTVLRFIFEQAPGSRQGKILLATMCLAGLRNHEVYRNFTENFRIKKQEVVVPGPISGKHQKTRVIPILNDYYWQQVEKYLNSAEYLSNINEAGHFLPMKRLQSKKVAERSSGKQAHATDNVKRPVWNALKKHFKLDHKIRPYDFRHTFITNLIERMDIHEVVQYSGNSQEMILRHYAAVDKEKAKPKFADFQSTSKNEDKEDKEDNDEALNKETALSISETVDEIMLDVGNLEFPDAIKKSWDMFKGKRLRENHKIALVDYEHFVAIIRLQIEAGKLRDDEVKDWLEFQ